MKRWMAKYTTSITSLPLWPLLPSLTMSKVQNNQRYSVMMRRHLSQAWPDKEIPKRQASASAIPESAKEALVQDLFLQHSTSVKVLFQLGIDACREYQRSLAISVLARVRQRTGYVLYAKRASVPLRC